MSLRRVLVGALSFLVFAGMAFASSLDLKIKNVEIQPKPAGTMSAKIQLGTYRSYRMTVTIMKTTALPKGASFVVRTECIRQGKAIVIGEERVGDTKGWNIYATYDLYPGEAGPGNCMLRTVIDADHEIAETDESPMSNMWNRQAVLVSH